MYEVYRYFDDDGDENYDLIGVFPCEDLAQQYVVFYAVVHQISSDDLVLCFEERNLYEIIERGID